MHETIRVSESVTESGVCICVYVEEGQVVNETMRLKTSLIGETLYSLTPLPLGT